MDTLYTITLLCFSLNLYMLELKLKIFNSIAIVGIARNGILLSITRSSRLEFNISCLLMLKADMLFNEQTKNV